jgi:hypothetical protein
MIGGGSYEGTDFSAGSQTPEEVTSPTTLDATAGGEAGGGAENGGQGSDNGNAGS